MQKFLVIQTAFIGDAVLATGILEKLHKQYPNATIDFLVRKGNENLFIDHPFLNTVLVWDKQNSKYKNLLKLIFQIRKCRYDVVINVQRFAATGLLTVLSNAKLTIGYNKNPFSFLYNVKISHQVNLESTPLHEIERNQLLIESIAPGLAEKPKLYPSKTDEEFITNFSKNTYITIAPASVWFTKQFPAQQWLKLIKAIPQHITIYLLGGKTDYELCNSLVVCSKVNNIENLSGKLNFLQSAALMKYAKMNYVNDSAPMHFASAVNAPICAVYCSTIPAFGFGPLSDNSCIVEVEERLNCRPCGLHGKSDCPEGHFNCANEIKTAQLLQYLNL